MPALSFQGEWLDKLLSGSKQQTTRPQTDRFKVGYIVNVYNQQRRRITDKVMRRVTPLGEGVIIEKIIAGTYPDIQDTRPTQDRTDRVVVVPNYYAHFLGKVEITEIYDMSPVDCSGRSEWAKADGFTNFGCADTWFTKRYGENWYKQTWTVIRWDGWLERYFDAEV